MGIYLISYKLSHDQTYHDRLDQLLAQIQLGSWWGESGTAMVCESPETIDEFCDRVLTPWSFDDVSDIAVIFDLESGEGRSKGRFRDYSLFSIAPWMKRL
jgi:hypothetical protein